MSDAKKIVLEPKTQAFIDVVNSSGGKPLYELSYADARNVLENAQSSARVNKLPVDVEEHTLPVGPGSTVSVTIFKPIKSTGLLPS